MKVFGLEISRAKPVDTVEKLQSLSAVWGPGGWFGQIRESFAGAFQSVVTIDAPREVLAFSAVYSSVTGIASDVAKLRVKIVEEDADGICTEVKKNLPWLGVLYKPNKFQSRIDFVESWIISKLLNGNSYALKVRDQRGIVTQLHILDAQRVVPLVADNGDVYYQLAADHISGLTESITVPASEIIHDRMNCLFHPLMGVSPIYACGLSATMGNRIQKNSTKFFDNMSRPSGMLTAPASISDEVANRIKAVWETNFSGNNIGRLAVLGDGLKYEPMTIPAQQAQLIEQLNWTVNDVGRCFHYPAYKLGGTVPAGRSVESLNQEYYSECLQTLIEKFEASMDDGLSLPSPYYIEMDIDGLLRMDHLAQMQVLTEGVKGGIVKPNEARAKMNQKPVDGGDDCYMQQQNFSLSALRKRDALPNPFVLDKPTTNPTPSSTGPAVVADEAAKVAAEQAAKAMLDEIRALAIEIKAANVRAPEPEATFADIGAIFCRELENEPA